MNSLPRRHSGSRQSSASPSGLTDWNGKPIGTPAASSASSESLVQLERVPLPFGQTLVLAWDVRARLYRSLSVTDGPSRSSEIKGSWPSRNAMMPLLSRIGAVPDGWHRCYGDS